MLKKTWITVYLKNTYPILKRSTNLADRQFPFLIYSNKRMYILHHHTGIVLDFHPDYYFSAPNLCFCYYNSLDMCWYNKPTNIAKPKLIKVPIRIYSVSFLPIALERSLNINTDFAAISNPIALYWFNRMNPKTKRRSNIPIYLPAFSNESSDLSSSIFHLHIMTFTMTDETKVIASMATIINNICNI